MKKKWLSMLLILLVSVFAACGQKDDSAVNQANEAHDPGQQRLEEGNIQAVMDDTRAKFGRDDMTFLTYRFREGTLRMSIRILNEEKEDEIIRTFADAFQNTDATTLDVEIKDKGNYTIPLDQDYTDLTQYFTPKE